MNFTVSEIFGPTFQGEGPSMGRQATFLRLGGCNLACSWCDTPYTWDWTGQNGVVFNPREQLKTMAMWEVQEALVKHGMGKNDCDLLVITGGEPMLQQDAIIELLMSSVTPPDIEIETNGILPPRLEMLARSGLHFNVSPKLRNSGNPISVETMKKWTFIGAARFKFVVTSNDDFDEIEQLVEAASLPRERVWVMPEATDPYNLHNSLRGIAEGVLIRGWNLTTRLHVELWDSQRGR